MSDFDAQECNRCRRPRDEHKPASEFSVIRYCPNDAGIYWNHWQERDSVCRARETFMREALLVAMRGTGMYPEKVGEYWDRYRDECNRYFSAWRPA